MSDRQRQQAGTPGGPANPQALDRYSYVQNNPLKYTDPNGHCIGPVIVVCVVVVVVILVAGSLVAVSSSPTSGMRMGDYDWTDWSIPGLKAEANEDTTHTEQTPQAPPIPDNPTQSPGPDWQWRGNGSVGSSEGSWYNPKTGESLHPDLNHPGPIGPHWDYKDPSKRTWRVYPDGRVEPKQ